MAPKCSEDSNKGLMVTKLLSSRRSRCLTYVFRFTYMNKNYMAISLDAGKSNLLIS